MKLWIICILIIMMFTIFSALSIRYVTKIVDCTCDLTVLGIILSHDEIDAITTSFAELKANLNTMDSDDYYSAAAIMMVQLNHIRDMQYPLLQNVF